MRELTEGVHTFRTHTQMWAWLNHHGFSEEGGGGYDGTGRVAYEPEGWDWYRTWPFEGPEATVFRVDSEDDALPWVDHRGDV